MTKDKALKQALELVQRFIECDGISSSDYLDVRDAIKKALAQPEKDLWANATIDKRWYITREKEQKPMRPEIRKMWEEYFDKCFAAFADDYKKFMAQKDIEPVAWVSEIAEKAELMLEKPKFRAIPLYTKEQL